MDNNQSVLTKQATKTKTLIGWALVAAAIVAAALLLRKTVFKVQVIGVTPGSSVQGGPGPIPAASMGGPGPIPAGQSQTGGPGPIPPQ